MLQREICACLSIYSCSPYFFLFLFRFVFFCLFVGFYFAWFQNKFKTFVSFDVVRRSPKYLPPMSESLLKRSLYTYFKKCCRGERRMSIVEQRMHDWNEMWVLNINKKEAAMMPAPYSAGLRWRVILFVMLSRGELAVRKAVSVGSCNHDVDGSENVIWKCNFAFLRSSFNYSKSLCLKNVL